MTDPEDVNERQILRSWTVNAAPWTRAIETSSIASRKLVTDHAILEAVASVGARTVWDVGCGEGWLVRALTAAGMVACGTDAVPELIAQARRGAGEFRVLSYAEIANRAMTAAADGPSSSALRAPAYDAAVCNFSLLGKESVATLIAALAGHLVERGHLIIQTLHPVAACGENPYCDGWRPGSWAGFDAQFTAPAPWYFRTVGSWLSLLRRSGFELIECREPTAPGAATPASIIFICRQRRAEPPL